MVFVAVVGPCLVARGPSEAFPAAAAAAGASPVGALLVAAAAAEGALRPCPGVGRTLRVLLVRPGSFAGGEALHVSGAAAGSFAGAGRLLRRRRCARGG